MTHEANILSKTHLSFFTSLTSLLLCQKKRKLVDRLFYLIQTQTFFIVFFHFFICSLLLRRALCVHRSFGVLCVYLLEQKFFHGIKSSVTWYGDMRLNLSLLWYPLPTTHHPFSHATAVALNLFHPFYYYFIHESVNGWEMSGIVQVCMILINGIVAPYSW